MTEKEFFDLLIDTYMEQTGEDLAVDNLGYYLDYYLNNYPPEKLELKLLKKTAARIIHEFMVNVLKWPDLDWGDSTKLKDIYDCRVCANAIAQTYLRGIILASKENVFGGNEVLDLSQGREVIDKLMRLIKNEYNC